MPRKITHEEEAEIYYLYNYGGRIRTQEQIAAFYGITQSAVSAALVRFENVLLKVQNTQQMQKLQELGFAVSEARLRLIHSGAISSDAPHPQIAHEP